MLIDRELFDTLTDSLMTEGVIQKFENEHGKIVGKMMITLGELPEELGIEFDSTRKVYIFNGTFDFYDVIIGVALYLEPLEFASSIWVTPQTDEAIPPSDEWVRYFIRILTSHIEKDGRFGIPMYTYISEDAEFTVIPTL